jgi:hypothetical protein
MFDHFAGHGHPLWALSVSPALFEEMIFLDSCCFVGIFCLVSSRPFALQARCPCLPSTPGHHSLGLCWHPEVLAVSQIANRSAPFPVSKVLQSVSMSSMGPRCGLSMPGVRAFFFSCSTITRGLILVSISSYHSSSMMCSLCGLPGKNGAFARAQSLAWKREKTRENTGRHSVQFLGTETISFFFLILLSCLAE